MPLDVLGILKLANKYQVKSVRTVILRCLMEAWPQALDDWDHQRRMLDMAAKQCAAAYREGGRVRGKYLDEMFPEPASALWLAVECHVPQLVPITLYQLALVNKACEWGEVPEEHLRWGRRTARWALVEGPISVHAQRGREKLERLSLGGHGVLLDRARDCWMSPCSRALEALRRLRRDDLDYLYTLKMLEDQAAEKEVGLCTKCRPRTLAAIRRHRQEIWNNLPVFFDLYSSR